MEAVNLGEPAVPDRREDVRLMHLASSGDRHAQRMVANRLVRRVHRLARSILRGAADAEDAAQHALMEILRSAGTYRGEASIERWADRITARTVIRIARDRRSKQALLHDGVDPEAVGKDLLSDIRERVPRPVEEYLGRLSHAKREVLVLKHALGYSVDEIAKLVNISPNTVKDRLLSARRDVRRWIARDRNIGVGRGMDSV